MVNVRGQLPSAAPQSALVIGMLAGAAALGVATAISQRGSRAAGHVHDRSAAFRSYLADHLTGSDAAFAVVARLSESQPRGAESELFARLHREFADERKIVAELLRRLGGSPFKMRRLVGQAAGAVLQTAAGGEPGDMALFRTLESLAIGVQGKRCLWRVAQSLEPQLKSPARQSFYELELQAIDQWQHIDDRRLALASRTFAAGLNRS